MKDGKNKSVKELNGKKLNNENNDCIAIWERNAKISVF
jgi:hypothetical protein